MRYTPTLKLSSRLTAFVTVIVSSAIFILFVGGTLSFQKMGREYMNHYLHGVVEVVDKELQANSSVHSLQEWIPKLLKTSSIVDMSVSNTGGELYHFVDTSTKVDPARLFVFEAPLERNPGFTLRLKAIPPYIGYSYSFEAMGSITLAIFIIVICLIQGVKWLKQQLIGSELLEERGRMILAGRVNEYAKGDKQEWPFTASQALDRLIDELQDARQERSRFDTFIRSQTFLDQLTGAANRVLFDTKLESSLLENGARGAVVAVGISDIDLLRELPEKEGYADQLVKQVGECLSNVTQRYPDVVLARYYDAMFTILIPHQSAREIANMAVQCLKVIERLDPPLELDSENWCHIGISMYVEGERRGRIIDEAETALKSAQLQKINTWSRFQKAQKQEDERGSVRWRTLFEKSFTQENIVLFKQTAYLLNEQGKQTPIHDEVFVRIPEPNHTYLKASRFMPAVETVGFESMVDRAVMMKVINHVKHHDDGSAYSMNLFTKPFQNKEQSIWLRDQLLMLPLKTRQRLSFEFAESHIVKHLDFMRMVVKMISAFGCQVVIGQAGRSIVSTHYIKDLQIDYLKLHRSLIKRIEERHENQLFVRSIIGACADSSTRVIAVGVQSESELSALKTLGVHGVQGRLYDGENQFLPDSQFTSRVKLGKRNRWKSR